MSEICKKLCAIADEIGAIGKDRKNQQQGFMFRGIDQVMNTLHPLLAKHGVVIIPEVIETKREERTTKHGGNLIYTMHKIRYHFTADDGSEVCAVVVGEGMDSADKSSNKAMAIAYKYACFQVFCIPTEELAKDDPDAYTYEASMVTEQQLCRYIYNCNSIDDLRALTDMYAAAIQGNANVMEYYRQRKAEIKKGGAQ